MDQSIEEYKTLRSEIIRNFEASERNLLACITANGVALAYGIKESQPLVLLIAILIPIFYWIQQTFYRKNIAKIATYIATFLEGHESKLMWETRVNLLDSKEKRGLAYKLRAFLHPYPMLLIVSIFIFLWMLKPPFALLIFLVVASITWLSAIRAYKPYAKIRPSWMDGWKTIKLEEQSKVNGNQNIGQIYEKDNEERP